MELINLTRLAYHPGIYLPVPTSPAWELQVCAAVLGVFCGFYGMELRSVCLCDKHLMTNPSPQSPENPLIHSFTEQTL